VILRPDYATCFVEAGNCDPIRTACQLIVHGGGVLEVAEAGFQKILFVLGVAPGGFAGHKFLRLAGWNLKIEHQRFSRETIDVVFEMLDPFDEGRAVRSADPRGLVGEIRTDIAVC